MEVKTATTKIRKSRRAASGGSSGNLPWIFRLGHGEGRRFEPPVGEESLSEETSTNCPLPRNPIPLTPAKSNWMSPTLARGVYEGNAVAEPVEKPSCSAFSMRDGQVFTEIRPDARKRPCGLPRACRPRHHPSYRQMACLRRACRRRPCKALQGLSRWE